jgi:hypothetical protein
MSSFQIETTGSAIDELYEVVEPFQRLDAQVGYHLLKYITSIAGMLQEIENYSRDHGTTPGWADFVTVAGTPEKALPWLGQFVGVKIPDNLTLAQERALVSDKAGFRRGSPAAMRAAAQLFLTGTKTVNLYERDTSAYHLTVQTYVSETPDSAKVLAALISQKPAGIVMVYITTGGQTYQQLKTGHPLYSQVKSYYTNYNSVRSDVP